MKVLLLLLVACSALTYGCVPPLNDFRYSDNATLLHEVVTRAESDPQTGWSHWLGPGSPSRTWPANDDKVVVIPFCYVNSFHQKMLHDIFHDAWNLWFRRIGEPGPESGHKLKGFEETKDSNGKPLFCYADSWSLTWNPQVAEGTLVIMALFQDGYASAASIGYQDSAWNPSPARNQMRIAYSDSLTFDRNIAAHTNAHEMGHAFGLAHEHQRPDRDHYVHFDCSKLYGYDAVVAMLLHHPEITIEQLCKSSTLSMTSPWADTGFCAWAFSTEVWYNPQHKDKDGVPDGHLHPYTMLLGRDYDVNSIMHYDSTHASAVLNRPRDVTDMPLVKWLRGAPDYTTSDKVSEFNAEFIRSYARRGLSAGDLEAIKLLYPWTG